MSAAVLDLAQLLSDLELSPVDPATAIGEVDGLPTAITILSGDPVALSVQYRVAADGDDFSTIQEQLQGAPEEEVSLTCDDGIVRLSLYRLNGKSHADVEQVVRHFAHAIQSTDLSLDSGCLHCGDDETASVMLVEDRLTRVCPACLAAAVEEKNAFEAQLNTSSLSATLGLPGAIFFGAITWGAFWTLLEILLAWGDVREIELHTLTLMLMFFIAAGFGYCLGTPMGITLRRAVIVRRAPLIKGVLLTMAAVGLGEIVYAAMLLFRVTGRLDFWVAANLWPLVAEGYSGFWIACKVMLMVAVAGCCAASASYRKTIALDV